ncbi:hypothetical protein B0H11DRAFT_2037435 [Mycena galericulata]|nr:hypothetical protein B0H11DRAFT_2037435 [Mycena galericulata]
MNSAAGTALRLQQLCDSIASFLYDSPQALKACALVSPAFTYSAQRSLFSDIIFHPDRPSVDDLGYWGSHDEMNAVRRLCAVLKRSPHLIPFIRRLRIDFRHEVLTSLAEIQFSNVREVAMHWNTDEVADLDVITQAANLVSTPSLRRVEFWFPVFDSIRDIHHLFRNCSPAMESLFFYDISVNKTSNNFPRAYPGAKIKSLEVLWDNWDIPKWLVDSRSPFDLSSLTELKYSACMSLAALRFLELLTARTVMSLTRLVVNMTYCAHYPPKRCAG